MSGTTITTSNTPIFDQMVREMYQGLGMTYEDLIAPKLDYVPVPSVSKPVVERPIRARFDDYYNED